MKIVEYVVENWDSLPKSKFDELEVVVVKEMSHSEEGWGHHSYEGFGINKEGKCLWLFSSGCSCSGGPSSSDADMKALEVNNPEIAELEPSNIDFAALKVEFTSY